MSNIDKLFHLYSLRKMNDFNDLAKGQEETLSELVHYMLNDKNSSSARESVTLMESGIDKLEGKLNYDGVKDGQYYEVKLRNYDTNNLKQSKLNGEGSYSDYTWMRYSKHLSENPTLLISGFIDGKLLYIFSVPYNSRGLQERLKDRLTNYFGSIDSERKPNTYLRSLGFNYSHYCDDAELVFVADKEFVEKNEQYINKSLYQRLIKD